MLISKIYLKGVLMWCEWTLTRWVKVASNAGRHTPLFKHRCSHYVCFFHSSEPGWARLSAASSCDTCLITWVLASSPLRLLAPNSNDHLNLNSSCRFFAWISFSRLIIFILSALPLSGAITLPWRMEWLSREKKNRGRQNQTERIAVGVEGEEELSRARTTVALTFRQFSTGCLRWWSTTTLAFGAWHYSPSGALFKYYLWSPLA